MYPEMRYEQVVYQNPFLAMRIWQIESEDLTPEAIRLWKEQDWKQKKYSDWHWHYHE